MRRSLPLGAALLAASLLVLATPGRTADEDGGDPARVDDLAVSVDGTRLLVSFALEDAIDAEVRRRLASGLPTGFVYDVELLRDRKRWLDKQLDATRLQVVAMYNAVTREYLINYKLDGTLIESRVVRDPEALERALTRFEGVPMFPFGVHGDGGLSADVADGERLLLRVRAELGTGTFLFFVPTTRTTEWTESRKFVLAPEAVAAKGR